MCGLGFYANPAYVQPSNTEVREALTNHLARPLLGLQPLWRPGSFERRNIGRKTKIKENAPNGRAPSIYQLKEMPPPTSAIATTNSEGNDELDRNDGFDPAVLLR